MKRFLAFTFAVYLISLPVGLAYASFASPVVSRLAAVGATSGASGITIPAKVTGVTSGGLNVASWISLLIPGGNVAKIAVAVAGVGGALAADYLMAKGAAWWAAKNLRLGTDGIFEESKTVSVPDGWVNSDFTDETAFTIPGMGPATPVYEGLFATMYAASDAMIAWGQASGGCSGSSSYGTLSNPKVGYYYIQKKANSTCGMTAENHFFFYPLASGGNHNETVWSDVANSYVEGLLTTDYSNGVPAANVLGLAGVEVAAAALDNPNHPVNQNAAAKAAIAAALAGSINANQLSNLEGAATPNVGDNVLPDTEPNVNSLTPAQIAAAVQAALAGQGLSASQIAAAIAAAQAAAAGGASAAEIQAAMTAALAGAGLSAAQIQAAVEAATAAAFPPVGAYTGEFAATAWAAPTVGDFAGLFSSFLNDMRNTPLFSLPGLLSASVPSGGSCEMSVNMSERFGGSKTISICNWETGLSGVKAALLCVASIFAIGIVTKGGG